MSLAASEIKVAYGTALMELARGLVKEGKVKEAPPLLRAAIKVDAKRALHLPEKSPMSPAKRGLLTLALVRCGWLSRWTRAGRCRMPPYTLNPTP